MDDISTRQVAVARTRRGLTLTTLCLAILAAQIDTSIVNLAARPIGTYFSAGVAALQWVVDGYNLVYAVLLLTGGLLADLYGRRRIFVIGAAIFTAASLQCALAPTVSILILGRAIAGLGAALLLPASLAIVRVVWQNPAERGRALGIWAACHGLVLAIGPTLGGVLIGQFGWRSIFFVVVPLSLGALILAFASIPESSDPEGRHFDLPAQVFGALALGSLAFAAIESHEAPGIAVIAFLVALVSFALFMRIEAGKGAVALVPLDIFRVREFKGAVTATAGMTFGCYGMLFLLPLMWQSTGRLDAAEAGLALMPMALVFVAVSPFSGALVGRFGARAVTVSGVAIMGTSLLLIGFSAHRADILFAEIGLALTGLGLGFATGPLMGVAVGAVSAARSGTAGALINVARMAGATIGVAILGTVFALAQGGPDGLRLAMLAGGCIQIACAATAWITMGQRGGWAAG
jgi:EmrB/QacA subfamily drug resistance transporter